MNKKHLANLPPEIIFDIISRLPVKSVLSCKCVCKSWFNMINTPEFAKTHLSKSVPGLVVCNFEGMFKIFEFNDEQELERHEDHYNPVTEFDLWGLTSNSHFDVTIDGSADGLLYLRSAYHPNHDLFICNPITHEYVQIPRPDRNVRCYPAVIVYGFGATKLTNQHKLVRIRHERTLDPETQELLGIPKSDCKVYTLGTGSWRSIPPGPQLEYNCRSSGALLNGNLHWLVLDLKGNYFISCLDLETEMFSTFPAPYATLGALVALEGCLCICSNSSENEIVIWMMKECGVGKSWCREFVIKKTRGFAGETYEAVYPLKIFRDGDVLMRWDEGYELFYSSIKTKTTCELLGLSEMQISDRRHSQGSAALLNPTILPLNRFVLENVISILNV